MILDSSYQGNPVLISLGFLILSVCKVFTLGWFAVLIELAAVDIMMFHLKLLNSLFSACSLAWILPFDVKWILIGPKTITTSETRLRQCVRATYKCAETSVFYFVNARRRWQTLFSLMWTHCSQIWSMSKTYRHTCTWTINKNIVSITKSLKQNEGTVCDPSVCYDED